MYRFGCQEFEIQRIDYQDGPEKSRAGDCIGPFSPQQNQFENSRITERNLCLSFIEDVSVNK